MVILRYGLRKLQPGETVLKRSLVKAMIAAIICIRFIALVVAVTPYGWEKLKANSGHFVSLFVDVVRLVR